MKNQFALLFILPFLLVCNIVNHAQVFQKLDQAYSSGAIAADEMILNKFYYMFEPSKVNKAFIADISKPLKCGTPIIMEYISLKSLLNKSTQDIVENYLMVPVATSDYISSGEHFKISYATTGVNAVPSEDANTNGVPDYVEWIAAYLETAWNVEITQCGFRGPIDTQGDGYYNISFEDINGYGFTYPAGNPLYPVDGNEGTRMVLDNDFKTMKNGTPFPPNQDYIDGAQKGTAKVTCAHEFKHASQHLYASWVSVGRYWIELDAAWAEELVFDYVNDSMLNFTGPGEGDPFSSPDLPLDEPVAPDKYFYAQYLP